MFSWFTKLVSPGTHLPSPSADPVAAEQCKDRGNAHLAAGELEAAVACYAEAINIDAGYAEAYNNLGLAHSRLDRAEEAIECFRTAARLKPSLAQPHNNLGNIFRERGCPDEAEACFREALARNPGYPEAYSNLGVLCHERGCLDEARTCLERAVAMNPDFAEAHNNLGSVYRELGQVEAALVSFRTAVELNSGLPEAHNNLGTIAQDQGNFDAAYAHYDQALACKPDYAEAMSNTLLTAQYDPSMSISDLYERHLRFAQRFEQPLRGGWPEHTNSRDADRRLRIGFVSGDLRSHPVGFFLEDVLTHINRQSFEITLFPTNMRSDAVTARLRAAEVAWRPLAGVPNPRAAQAILDAGIDILVDLSGHTADNRLPLFARKPAPIQVSWMYFSTTGLSAFDYLLCDRYVLPPGDECWFVERPWRLPDSYLCFTPPHEDVPVAPLPALNDGRVTFGCFNNLSKLNEEVFDCWARILRTVPASQLFLKSKQLADATTREAVHAHFGKCGIAPSRLILEGPSPRADYLRCYDRVDIALDPFPFPGGMTTVEALWMGVPVLSRRGDRFISRAGESLLQTGGLSDWIAEDNDDYVAKAAAFAAGRENLARLRETLREQFLASPLCDAAQFARNLEVAFRGMWAEFASGMERRGPL